MKKSDFQYKAPYLNDLRFTTNPSFDKDRFQMKNSFDVQVKMADGKKEAVVTLTLETNKDDDNAPFVLFISVESLFAWTEEYDDDDLNALLRINAPALLLGYMRPIVANITNSSQFPTYNIPFINFTK